MVKSNGILCVFGDCLRQSTCHSTSCGSPTASGREPGGGGGGGGRGHCCHKLGPAVLAAAVEDAEAEAGCWLLLLGCAVLWPWAAWLAA